MINYAKTFKAAVGPMIAAMLLSLFGYKVAQSKRVKQWLASRRRD